MIRRTAMLLAFLMLFTAAGTARADTSDEVEARRLFKEGLSLHDAHDYAGALTKFRAAYRRWKNPKILANIGTAAWELGRYAVAANAYDRFLAEAPADAPDRAEVQKALREVLPKVGTLVGSVTGPVKSVSVDGQPVETARLGNLHVEPGRHTVVAIGTSDERAEQEVKVIAGARVMFTLRLEAAPAAKPGAPKPAEPTHAPPEPPREKSALPWIVGGVGAASLIASAVLYSMRGSTETELKTQCIGSTCPASSQGKIDKANRLGMASAVTFGVGVAGLGVATYLFLKPGSKQPASEGGAVGIRVTATPHSAAATLAGRF